jgi:hypothetical protein
MEEIVMAESDDPARPQKSSGNVFISYARGDKDVAQALARKLNDRGIPTWLDIEKIREGENWDENLREAINASRLCVVLVSDKTTPLAARMSKEWATIQYLTENERKIANHLSSPPRRV